MLPTYPQVPALSSASVWGHCRVQGCSGQFGDTDGVKGCSDWFGDIDKVKGCSDRFGDIAKWKDAQTSLGTLLGWRDSSGQFGDTAVVEGCSDQFEDTASVEWRLWPVWGHCWSGGTPLRQATLGALEMRRQRPLLCPHLPLHFPLGRRKMSWILGGRALRAMLPGSW